MHVNPVLTSLGTYPMAPLQEKARAMRSAGETLTDFSLGDPREPTPPFIPAALKAAVPEISQYPTTAGMLELRTAVAAYIRRRFGVTVDPVTQVLATGGSKEAIFSTAFAFVNRGSGDGVIWPTPGYPVYERGALFAGAIPMPVQLDTTFVLKPEQVDDDAWAKASMLWVNYPHNPTGAVATSEELAAIYGKARAADTLVCSDECYTDVYESEPPPSMLQVADEDLTGLLVYLSLSKRSGMTGYRSAAIVGDTDAIAALRELRSSTGTAAPEFVQAAAVAAWSDDAHPAVRRAVFSEKRAVLRKAFEDLGYRIAASEGALYLWVEVGDDAAVAKRLLDYGVVVSPGRAFGAGGEGYIRLALVPTVEECEAAVEVLRSCLTGN
ncbi:MAG: aminotransferase class I/II-fold pyridoxal phosphate-dependent enzyme [Gammaproteobacteria bacterium]|nr:aminotransferase class I/II-fold pyridoxal phosphate-dependent enzyme [Gammaproteobacteria bacterium]